MLLTQCIGQTIKTYQLTNECRDYKPVGQPFHPSFLSSLPFSSLGANPSLIYTGDNIDETIVLRDK